MQILSLFNEPNNWNYFNNTKKPQQWHAVNAARSATTMARCQYRPLDFLLTHGRTENTILLEMSYGKQLESERVQTQSTKAQNYNFHKNIVFTGTVS
jgi:hypothetical protein